MGRRRRPGRARSPDLLAVAGAGFAVVGAAIFAGITISTGGHWWQQTIVANIKDFNLDQALAAGVFSPDGQWIAIAKQFQMLELWRTDGEASRLLKGPGM